MFSTNPASPKSATPDPSSIEQSVVSVEDIIGAKFSHESFG